MDINDHFDNGCTACVLLRRADSNLQTLKSRRAVLIRDITRFLASRDLTIEDLRLGLFPLDGLLLLP